MPARAAPLLERDPVEEQVARVFSPIWRLLDREPSLPVVSWEHEAAASLLRARACIAVARGADVPRRYEYATSDGRRWAAVLQGEGRVDRKLLDADGRERPVTLVFDPSAPAGLVGDSLFGIVEAIGEPTTPVAEREERT